MSFVVNLKIRNIEENNIRGVMTTSLITYGYLKDASLFREIFSSKVFIDKQLGVKGEMGYRSR